MYEIESLEGYVLAYYNTGEADRRYKILTRERGVVIGSATSVRKESSKLKHFLQRYNHIQFDFVHGKGGYRITGGQLWNNPTKKFGPDALGVLARVSLLVQRLTQDQDEHTNLFYIYQQTIDQLSTQSTEYGTLEQWATGRVLHEFGYFDISHFPDISPEIFKRGKLHESDIKILEKHEKHLERYIRECIQETML